MKINVTFTKAIFVALFVLGFVMPVAAEQIPQPFKSLDNTVIDWWDEFDQDSYSQPVKVEMPRPAYSSDSAPGQMLNTHMGPVIDWSDEFEYQDSATQPSETTMASKAMGPERVPDEYWDWEALSSI